MVFRKSAAQFIATGGHTGKLPVAPGTFGTVLGLPICFGLSYLPFPHAVFIGIALIAAAVWAAGEAVRIFGDADPGCVVVDEIVGMVVTLLGLPFGLKTAVLGFVVFRLLDIVKPPPIRYLEKRLPGGLGVVMDDVAAGLIGNLTLRLVLIVTGV